MTSASDRIERAVLSIYPEIHRRATTSEIGRDERVLWKELCCCVLSSQVRYPVAVAGAEALDNVDALLGESASAERIEEVLRRPLLVEGRQHRYRFPRSKGIQLAATHDSVRRSGGNLRSFLDAFLSPEDARLWFVANAPGLGPKQASMFLRNSGMTYDLAVLDRHVLAYMQELGMIPAHAAAPSNMKAYKGNEIILRDYADRHGMLVGLLDWAIWIVMRVFKERNREGVFQ